MFPMYKFSREDTQPENMCDIVFEKVQVRAGKINLTSAYAEPSVRRVLEKGFMRNFPEFTKKYICQDFFFNNGKLCRFEASLKTSL